jgi:hypothetical protein
MRDTPGWVNLRSTRRFTMRLISVTLCAATVAAATLFPATVAMAGDESGTVTVSPSVIAPGEDVDLRVHCGGGKIIGTSAVFAAQVVFSPAADKGAMYAEARIRADVTANEYPVEVWCKGRRSAGVITVVRKDDAVLPTPTAPVHAGGGGTAVLAADQDGAATRNAVVGLMLAGAAAVTVAARSFRRRRDSE